MTSLPRTAFLAAALMGLGACASTPDPAEICTVEWIMPRANAAVAKIQKRATSSLSTLRNVSEKMVAGKTPGPFDQLALFNAVRKLDKEVTRGQGIKDLKTVAQTCNDPQIVGDSLRGLMQEQGISDSLIARIESFPMYQTAISTLMRPEPVTLGEPTG